MELCKRTHSMRNCPKIYILGIRSHEENTYVRRLNNEPLKQVDTMYITMYNNK